VRFWRVDSTRDVGDEMEFHLQSAIDEFIAQGMTPGAASDAARRKFGDVDGVRRTLITLSQQRERHMRRTEWFDALKHDLVFGLRQLRKSPAFTLVAVLTLALGIGANSAIFSVVYTVLLQPLPFAHGDRILTFAQYNGQGTNCCLPYGNFAVWKAEATDFEGMSATLGARYRTLTGRGEPTPLMTVPATGDFWKVQFIPPVVGRYFGADDDRESASPVAVLSYALWQNRFSGDPGIIGQAIVLEGRPVTIVGVAPQDYVLTPPAERLWMPLAMPASRLSDFGDHEFRVYGLLKPGVSLEHATRQLEQIDTRLAKEHPNHGYDGRVKVTPIVDSIVGPHRALLYTLLGAVVLVLLIACGNIANLLLARATVRRGEIAIRGALGATQRRIVSQLLVESALLSAGGGALGLLIAVVGIRFLASGPARMPRLQSAALNVPVLAFTLAVAVLCAIGFGLVPAIRAARLDLQQTLRDGGRDSGAAARETLRRALVVSELCVAQILLIGAGLLIRSTLRLQAVPAGFDTSNLLVVSTVLPRTRYPNVTSMNAAFEQIQGAIAAIPGVRSVARTQAAPIYTSGWDWDAKREGSNGHDDGAVDSNMRFVTSGYFSTLGLRLLRGRDFTRADEPSDAAVAIVSRGLAKRLWGEDDPIGKRISNGGSVWRRVIGVVDDMHADGLGSEPPREMYLPAAQVVNPGQSIIIRGSVPVTTLMPAIRRAVATVDPLLALSGVSTIEKAMETRSAMSRFSMLLLTLLGATGLVLAVVGVYGVIAYFVTQRTHEFGVRIALGASPASVRWLVVKQGFALAGVGVSLGAAMSLVATRVLDSMMYDTRSNDPLTYGVVMVLLAVVAVVASYIPARRATRIDPLEALRSS
jgi:putative ABC transport system permease protein